MSEVREEKLARFTSLGLGGAARLVCVEKVDELRAVLREARASRLAVRVLGGGSNVVVADEGVADALVVKIDLHGVETSRMGSFVEMTAAAGEPWDDLVRSSVESGLAGIECLSGIPGSVGAVPIQNVGAYGQEVSETIVRVDVLDREQDHVETLSNDACEFSYRHSRLKGSARDRYVVLGVTFRLRPGGAPTVRYADIETELARSGRKKASLVDVREAVLGVRAGKSMLLRTDDENGRSCGSFFLNPIVDAATAERVGEIAGNPSYPRYAQPDGRVKLPAAWLIEAVGFAKGDRHGSVGISTRHSLAIVAHDGASAREVVELAGRIRDAVEQRFGVRLRPEPDFWGFARLDDGLPALSR